MTFDWVHLKKTRRINRKRSTDWNPQGARRHRRQRKTWITSVEEDIGQKGKTWREVERLANDRTITGNNGWILQHSALKCHIVM
jgi:hypothetical protein